MIPQGTTLYAISEQDGSTTVYLVIGWEPGSNPPRPYVVQLNVPGQPQLLDLAGKTVTYVTELPSDLA